jgi:hypothetical protein
MLSLRGYETLPAVNGEGIPCCTMLLGTGVALTRAMTNYALSFLIECNFEAVSMPLSSFSIPPTTVHALLGCTRRGQDSHQPCTICQSVGSSSIVASPLVTLSLFHRGKTYWDRQLPLNQVCLATTESSNNQPGHKKQKRKWYDRLDRQEQVEFFALTGPTVEESRAVQMEFVGKIRTFYESLLLSTEERRKRVRIRCISPSDLASHEASCIVVEGRVSENEWTPLARVSNSAEYLSRACRTRCGGVHDEYVHTIHGCFCNAVKTVDWMLHNNVTNHDAELGVGIPSSSLGMYLIREFGPHHFTKQDTRSSVTEYKQHDSLRSIFLPFLRRVESRKNKLIITELHGASKPRIVGDCNNDVTNARTTTVITSAKGSPKKREPFALDRFPNREEIKGEAAVSPFPFLPIGR